MLICLILSYKLLKCIVHLVRNSQLLAVFYCFFFLPRNMSSSQFCYSFLLKPFYCVEGLTLQKGNSSLLVLVDNGEFLNNATAAL